nr:hypothetical protein [Cyanidiaceae sp.]
MKNNIAFNSRSLQNSFTFDQTVILLLIRVSIKFNIKLINYSRKPLFLDLISVLAKKTLFCLAVKSFKDTIIALKIRNCSSLFINHNSLLIFNFIVLKLLRGFYDIQGLSIRQDKKFLILFQNESLYKLCAFEFINLTEIVFASLMFDETNNVLSLGSSFVPMNKILSCLENFLVRVSDCVVYFSIKYNYYLSFSEAFCEHSWIKSFKDIQRLFIYLLFNSYFYSIIETAQQLNNSMYKGWIVRGCYIDSTSFDQLHLNRPKELPKISLLVLLLMNVVDVVIPQVNIAISWLGKAIVFILSGLRIKSNLF